eukprot:7360483-Pyramimonas_sp.AAC.1
MSPWNGVLGTRRTNPKSEGARHKNPGKATEQRCSQEQWPEDPMGSYGFLGIPKASLGILRNP